MEYVVSGYIAALLFLTFIGLVYRPVRRLRPKPESCESLVIRCPCTCDKTPCECGALACLLNLEGSWQVRCQNCRKASALSATREAAVTNWLLSRPAYAAVGKFQFQKEEK